MVHSFFHLSLIPLVLLVSFRPLQGQERTRQVTPDDYFSLASVMDLALSPDGKTIAYCEARWEKAGDDRKSNLWVVSTNGKTVPQRLTSDRANERHPRWTFRNDSLYVLANRKRAGETKPPYDGSTQVWQVFLDGRDPKPVTQVVDGITAYDLAYKSNVIYYVVDKSTEDKDAFSKLRSSFDKLEYSQGKRKVSEVYRLDLTSWRTEKIIAEKRYIRELAVTERGSRVAMITAPDDLVISSEGNSRVEVWDADSKKVTGTDENWRKTSATPYPWLENLAWNPAGTRLSYVNVYDAHPAEVIINTWSDSKPTAVRMKRPKGIHVRGYGSPLGWLDENTMLYLGEKAGSLGLISHDMETGEGKGTIKEGESVTGFTISTQSKTVASVRGSSSTFPEIYAAKNMQLTTLNPQTKNWKLPTVKHIFWKAPDGTNVGGVLELPAGYKGGKLPLVVGIHGGPTTAVYSNLEFNPYDGRMYFAAKGYAVLCPNYRGSTGYGDKHVTDLIANENDIEVKDILAGIQHLVKEGIADPERIAVMGWSNGGYLTNCLITLKNPPVIIRAASSGAGILDTVAEWGFNDEPAYPMVFKKGLPWETPEIYRKTSPSYGLGNVKTPTLIHVGANDVRCPPGHSRMLYRALHYYQKVPTELVVYPNEPHGLRKYTNRKAKMEWDLAWFSKFVLGDKDKDKE